MGNMKKLIRTAAKVILVLLIIPFVLEKPVHSLLESFGMTGEYSYEILLGVTAVILFLIMDRKRIRARRQRRRAARAQWREREKLRNSYVLNLSPYEYEEYVAEALRQEGFTDVDTTPKSGDFGADVLAMDGVQALCAGTPGRREGRTGDLQREGLLRLRRCVYLHDKRLYQGRRGHGGRAGRYPGADGTLRHARSDGKPLRSRKNLREKKDRRKRELNQAGDSAIL